jgi:hypothetical protein
MVVPWLIGPLVASAGPTAHGLIQWAAPALSRVYPDAVTAIVACGAGVVTTIAVHRSHGRAR